MVATVNSMAPRPRLGSAIEIAANLAMIATCVAVCAFLGWRILADPARPRAPVPKGYSAGEPMDNLDGVVFSSSPKSLVLFVASTCRFCADSMPTYAAWSRTRHGRFQIVAAGLESPDVLRRFMALHGVEVDAVVTVRPGDTKLFATPTALVIDRSGRVVSQWVGSLGQRASALQGDLSDH